MIYVGLFLNKVPEKVTTNMLKGLFEVNTVL